MAPDIVDRSVYLMEFLILCFPWISLIWGVVCLLLFPDQMKMEKTKGSTYGRKSKKWWSLSRTTISYGRRGKKQRRTRTSTLGCHRTAWELSNKVTVSDEAWIISRWCLQTLRTVPQNQVSSHGLVLSVVRVPWGSASGRFKVQGQVFIHQHSWQN